MAKKVDRAGHWLIKDNPLSEEGVYMYSGRVIDPNGINGYGLEPDVLYPVYRPREELRKGCESFNGVEMRNEHEMIGDGAGMTPADSSVGGGTIFNVRMNPDKPSEMIGDMRISGEELRNEIRNGKKQLSLGYFCKYRREDGEFDGKPYKFVQFDLEGNHVALVKEGRMGSGVRVFDSMTFDSMEVVMKPTEDKKEQGGGLREEISKMLEGKDENILKAVKDAVENVVNPKKGTDGEEDAQKEGAEDDPCPHCGTELGLSEKGKGKDEAEDAEEKPADEKKDDEDDDKTDEDGDDPSDKKDESSDCGDAAENPTPSMDMKEAIREIALRDRIYDGVVGDIGAFDHSEMTATEIAQYACDHLELPTSGDCLARIEGYIAARGKSKNFVVAHAEDSAEASDFVKNYLK